MPDGLRQTSVDVRVPAEPSMSRVLRLAASGVASLAGFSVDEIEDIKVAVSEVLLALVEHGEGAAIDVRFVVTESGLEIHGRSAAEHFDAQHPDLAVCSTVLASVCTEHGLEHQEGSAHIWAMVAHVAVG
ncbi:MAG: hypothetical protein Q7V57_00585 [Actinomycetota bacterium]|nr:hypothetical protein [Actinomycetota bacterium]